MVLGTVLIMRTQIENIIPLKAVAAGSAAPLEILQKPALHEVVPASWKSCGAVAGFASAIAASTMARANAPCVWVQQRGLGVDLGMPFGPGLRAFGLDVAQILFIETPTPQDFLGVMEEALSTPALGLVVGALAADTRAYDLTASRRLQLRAEENDVPAVLMRAGGPAGASAAFSRWRIESAPSFSLTPRWQACLVKSRVSAPGQWQMEWNHETHALCVAAPSADGSGLPQHHHA